MFTSIYNFLSAFEWLALEYNHLHKPQHLSNHSIDGRHVEETYSFPEAKGLFQAALLARNRHTASLLSDRMAEMETKSISLRSGLMGYNLHTADCTGSPEDILRMAEVLREDPEAVERPQQRQGHDFNPGLNPPLHEAVKFGHRRCIEFLLKNGANIHSITSTQYCKQQTIIETLFLTPCHSKINFPEIAILLLENGASPNTYSNEYQSPTNILEYGILSKSQELIKKLLECGAKTENTEEEKKRTKKDTILPMTLALLNWELKSVKLLLMHGAKLYYNDQPELSIPQFLLFSINNAITNNKLPQEVAAIRLLQAFKIFKVFGGNLWARFRFPVVGHEQETVLEYLLNRPDVAEQLSSSMEALQEVVRNPLSLMSLSRLVVRNQMGRDYWKNIQHLEIPDELKDFLNFQDLEISDCPQDLLLG